MNQPMQQQPMVMGGPPGGDWRKELTQENRTTVISKMYEFHQYFYFSSFCYRSDVLKEYPGADRTRVLELARRFETQVFSTAPNKVRSIDEKSNFFLLVH